ncbi:MAG: hypothetical protein ACYCZN_09715 [Candidatus Dormibacteria bacterium]
MSETKARAGQAAVRQAALVAWMGARQTSCAAQAKEVAAYEALVVVDFDSGVPKPGHYNRST